MTTKLTNTIASMETSGDTENYATVSEVERAILRIGKEKSSGNDGLPDCVFHEINNLKQDD
jgi:hypothetical protein